MHRLKAAAFLLLVAALALFPLGERSVVGAQAAGLPDGSARHAIHSVDRHGAETGAAEHHHHGASAKAQDHGSPAGDEHDGCGKQCCAAACHAVNTIAPPLLSVPRSALLVLTPAPDRPGADANRALPERPPRSA